MNLSIRKYVYPSSFFVLSSFEFSIVVISVMLLLATMHG